MMAAGLNGQAPAGVIATGRSYRAKTLMAISSCQTTGKRICLAAGSNKPGKGAAMAKDKKKVGKVRWGIISTANIGVEKVIPGMLKSSKFEVRAIASRELPTAKKWA
jgi:hypothetical protein